MSQVHRQITRLVAEVVSLGSDHSVNTLLTGQMTKDEETT